MERVYIIGYTMDAVMEAVSLATQGDKEVILLATAEVGQTLDDYGDLVSQAYREVLDAVLPGMLEFTEYANPRFFYIPYEKVAISNSTNGVIQYPLSKKSFNDENEWKECVEKFADPAIQEVINNQANAPSKLVTVLKNKMPQKFVNTFCKALQATRWRGIQLSHLSMNAFTYEFPFTELGNDNYNEFYYRPNHTYHEICAALTNVFNITVERADDATARKYITDRNIDGKVLIMDNRVDQYLDYVAGRFDRVRMWSVNEKVPPELRYSRDGLYYTPLNSCWAVTLFDGKCKKYMAEEMTTLYDNFTSEIPSTKTNLKLHNQYCDLVGHYGNKKLDLGQRVLTLVKA